MKKYKIVIHIDNNEPIIREAHFNNFAEANAQSQIICAMYNIEFTVKIEIKKI